MKSHRQRTFVKLQCDILDRFEDDRLLLLFVKLLCLMDREGRIRLDYDAIAARIHWHVDQVIQTMGELMQPDLKSRCQKYQGACVVPIDADRPNLGFFIPAAASHRKRNAKTEARRMQQRLWAREKRRQASTSRRQASTSRRLPPPSKSTSVDIASTSVDKKSTAIEIEIETNMNGKSGGSNPRASSSHVDQPRPDESDLLHDVDSAKVEISKQIFCGRLHEKNWTHEALRALAELMPMSKAEIWTMGFYYEETKQQETLSLVNLLRWWPDRITKAILWEESNYPAP